MLRNGQQEFVMCCTDERELGGMVFSFSGHTQYVDTHEIFPSLTTRDYRKNRFRITLTDRLELLYGLV